MTRVLVVTLVGWLATAAPAVAQTFPGASDRLYGTAEYLLWWMKDSPAPTPLIATDRLDVAGSQVVLGGRDIDSGERHGGRFTLGYWLTRDQTWGIEGKVFFLPETTVTNGVFSSGADGSQQLAAPFFSVIPSPSGRPPGEAGFFLAAPGNFGLTARESLTSSMKGGELNVARRVAGGPAWRLEWLGGFRYLDLKETYTFSVDSPLVPPVPGHVYQFRDVFDARNRFYGGQLGVRGEYRRGSWIAGGTAKMALGVMRQAVDVSGGFVTSEFNPILGPDDQLLGFGAAQQFGTGFFAQRTNIGSHDRNVFAVVPELSLNVGYDLTSWASVFVGYTFLYASNVARAANQIDRNLNPSQSELLSAGPSPAPAGPAAPAFKFRGTDFWAQGLNVGVAFRY